MRDFTPQIQSIIDGTYCQIFWFFRVTESDGTVHRWSTRAISADTSYVTGPFAPYVHGYNEEYASAWNGVVLKHSGIQLNRGRGELRVQAPNDFEIIVANSGNTLTASDFENGGSVLVSYGVSDGTNKAIALRFGLNVKSCEPIMQTLKFKFQDWLKEKLEGSYYPNNQFVDNLFPSENQPKKGTNEKDQFVVPVCFGEAYLPCRSIWYEADTTRYYLLGPNTLTYSVKRMHTPYDLNHSREWIDDGNGGSYDLDGQQSDKSDGVDTWRVVEPLIIDLNNDGTADACGFFMGSAAEKFLDPCIQFTRSDTATMTQPGNCIRYALKGMGVSASRIGWNAIAAANTTYASWSLEWTGGYTYQQKSEKILADMLLMCHSRIALGETAELEPLSKTSVKTLTKDHILQTDSGSSSFTYTRATISKTDSCSALYQVADKPQDSFQKVYGEVTLGTHSETSSDILESVLIQDAQIAAKLGGLYAERKYNQAGNGSIVTGPSCLGIQPDDVITINHADYGGSTKFLVDHMHLKPSGLISFKLIKFASDLRDFTDVLPSAITVETESTANTFSPVIQGPDSTSDSGNPTNQMSERVWIGESLVLDGGDDPFIGMLKNTYASTTAGIFLGVNTDVPQINCGDADSYYKWSGAALEVKMAPGETFDLAGSLDVTGDISVGAGSDINIEGDDATGDKGQINLDDNIHIGAAASYIAAGIWTDTTADSTFVIGAEPITSSGLYSLKPFEIIFFHAEQDAIIEAVEAAGADLARIDLAASSSSNVINQLTKTDTANYATSHVSYSSTSDAYYTWKVADGDGTLELALGIEKDRTVSIYSLKCAGAVGTLTLFTYQNDSIADDATVSLPDATAGFGRCICNAEHFTFFVQSDGTVSIEGASANTSAANVDGDLCIFNTGTQARVGNRLNTTGKIRIEYWYN